MTKKELNVNELLLKIDEAWKEEYVEELWTKHPFDFIQEQLNEFEEKITELMKKNKKLKKIVASHNHVDGKVFIELE